MMCVKHKLSHCSSAPNSTGICHLRENQIQRLSRGWHGHISGSFRHRCLLCPRPLTPVISRTGLVIVVPAPQVVFLRMSCQSPLKSYFLGNVFFLPSRQNGSLSQGRKARCPAEGEQSRHQSHSCVGTLCSWAYQYLGRSCISWSCFWQSMCK